MLELLETDPLAPDNEEWRQVTARYLARAARFELHCWNEEEEALAMALRFGTLRESQWAYGRIVAGPVTDAFRRFLLELPKPADVELYNKMTPFFSIFLDDCYFSGHYGTELYGAPERN